MSERTADFDADDVEVIVLALLTYREMWKVNLAVLPESQINVERADNVLRKMEVID